MFGGVKKKVESAGNSDIETIVGKNTAIKGEISGSGNIRIDGRVEGDIAVSGSVVIGKTGEVVGNIKAANLLVSGIIKGNIEAASSLNIFASGQLFGDTKAASFSIEEGAVFRGRSEMSGKKADAGEVVDIKKSKKA